MSDADRDTSYGMPTTTVSLLIRIGLSLCRSLPLCLSLVREPPPRRENREEEAAMRKKECLQGGDQEVVRPGLGENVNFDKRRGGKILGKVRRLSLRKWEMAVEMLYPVAV